MLLVLGIVAQTEAIGYIDFNTIGLLAGMMIIVGITRKSGVFEIGVITHMSVAPLWWALSLGACLGGNGTIVSASANVIVSGISAREGYPITFLGYYENSISTDASIDSY